MKRTSDRDYQAQGLQISAPVNVEHMDGPYVRCVLVGDMLHVWRRACRCTTDCTCWEFDKARKATAEEIAAIERVQKPYPGKPAPAALEENLVKQFEENLRRSYPSMWNPQEELLWR